jgi:alkylation response protein AidB-like acyl-CoA dehydrogenase
MSFSNIDLTVTPDQDLLRHTTARFVEAVCPLPQVRELVEDETGLPTGYLRRSADLGWFALLVPEKYGGGSISGDGIRDLVIVAEERGRALQPGPFVSMNVVAAALSAAGSLEQQAIVLPDIAAGNTVATWVANEVWGGGLPSDALTVTEMGDGYRIGGRASVIQEGTFADWLLVTAKGRGGFSQFLLRATAPGISITPLDGLDITQRVASISFDRVEVTGRALVGEPNIANDTVEQQLQLAILLTAAESVGAMDTLFEMARQYTTIRTAFGRPIGSFQAVKHQMADMSLWLESAKAITAAGTRAVQENVQDAATIVSIAKAWVADTGIDLAQGCFQVFGGVAYTWEHDAHLFVRRLTMNSLLFGQPDWHRERICRLNGI